MEGTIPKLVADKIIKNREHFHHLNAKAQEKQRLTSPDSPVARHGFATKPLELSSEMHFWRIEDDEELEEFLFEDLLSGLYGETSKEEWEALPSGYCPLVTVLEFERHCEFEGWTAVENRSEELSEIIRAYEAVGLRQEARAIAVVTEAFRHFVGEPDDLHDVLSAAYHSVPNSTPDFEDRVPVILQFVRINAHLFATHA